MTDTQRIPECPFSDSSPPLRVEKLSERKRIAYHVKALKEYLSVLVFRTGLPPLRVGSCLKGSGAHIISQTLKEYLSVLFFGQALAAHL